MITRIKIYLAIAAVLGFIFGGMYIRNLIQENNRLTNNQEAMFANEKMIATQKRELELSVSELKGVVAQDSVLKAVLRDSIKAKVRNIKQLTTLVSKSKLKIKVELKDTTIYRHDTVYVDKNFTWSDDWYKAKGTIFLRPQGKDSIEQTIIGRDSIYYVTERKKYNKIFFLRWFEKPKLVTTIWNANPHQEIAIKRIIKVK